MSNNTQEEINELEQKLAALKLKAQEESKAKLGTLHTDLGFKTRKELISALKGLGEDKSEGKRGSLKDPVKRASLIEDLKAKKSTDKQLAEKYGVSVPSIQKVKKEEGMTKTRDSK